MSKVLFLVNHDVVIYNFRLELVERLLSEGHHVVISSPYGERIDDLIKLGCEYHEITMSRHGINPLSELRLMYDYKKLIDSVCPDIVFSYTIKPNIYGAIVCRYTKVQCVANITGLGIAVENKGILQKLTVMMYKFAFANIRRVFFQNSENMHFFKEHGIALGKHTLLPGSGVNLNRFPPLPYPNEEKIEFAFISRIMKEKGVDQYLNAAERIKKKYRQTVFHVCGFCEQNYEKKLIQLHENGIIIYHGMVRNVKEILVNIHCTVHPSFYPEGISNVLLESSACARPIITTDHAGCREVIDDGVNGYIVKQRDTDDLIKKIECFIALPWEKKKEMGLAGRRKVEKEFNRQIVVENYMKELKNSKNVC